MQNRALLLPYKGMQHKTFYQIFAYSIFNFNNILKNNNKQNISTKDQTPLIINNSSHLLITVIIIKSQELQIRKKNVTYNNIHMILRIFFVASSFVCIFVVLEYVVKNS